MSIRIFDTPAMLYDAAMATVTRLANEAVAARGRFLLVLSGGSTPLPLFEQLAQLPNRSQIPWEQTHIFWADERMVPADDQASNFGQAWAVLLRHLPIPEGQIHPVNGMLDPEVAADAYAKELAAFAPPDRTCPRFDLVLLGLGEDGHTASLFPGSAQRFAGDALVLAISAEYGGRPASRVTLTPAAINSAREVIFLVAGKSKARALAQALTPGVSGDKVPARLIRPTNGSLTWFVDKDAASLLDGNSTTSSDQQHHIPKGDPHD